MGYHILASAERGLQAVAGIFFPSLCFSCGSLLPPSTKILCQTCLASMDRVASGDPLLMLARERLCGDGMLNDVTAVFHFTKGGPLQSAIHQLKYSGAPGIGLWLGGMVGTCIGKSGQHPGFDAVVPVPLHVVKRRERGYNQSERIAAGIGRVLALPVRSHWLMRTRHTPTQTTLGIAERRANMDGAFAVPRMAVRQVRGKKILLVDDVITTGATIRSCAEALRNAGVLAIAAGAVGLAERDSML
jgi:ComF family protein